MVEVDSVDTHVLKLPHHPRHFRRNNLALLTPLCRPLEHRDAFVHDGFEVFCFGVEGGYFFGHIYSWRVGWGKEGRSGEVVE